MMSRLPDDILVNILHRLETKNAVATSILSNRWRKLYRDLSHVHCTLDFNNPPEDFDEAQNKVLNFLDSLFNVICKHLYLKSLVVEFDLLETDCEDYLRGCIVAALNKKKMEHLELLNQGQLYFPVPFGSTPCAEDSCLQSIVLSKCLLIPSPVAETFRTFRSLKILALYNCYFYDKIVGGESSEELEDSEDSEEETVPYYRARNVAENRFVDLLSSCPVLENLTVEDCQVYPALTIDSSCSHLKQLIISRCVFNEVAIYKAPELERVECTTQHPFFLLLLPCLKHFKLEFIEDTHLIIGLNNISMKAPCLETLVLHFADETVWLHPGESSFPFKKLKSLILDAKRPEICNVFWIGLILEVAPLMEIFELRIDRKYFSEYLVEPLEQPSNFCHSHLKELKVTGFVGDAMDMSLVGFVMERAEALECITLICEGTFPVEPEIREQLEHLKERNHSNAQIILK